MPNEDTARFLNSGQWAEVNPTLCPCGGSGTFISDYDTFHRCPIHKSNDVIGNFRRAFAYFGEVAIEAGLTKSEFLDRVEAAAQADLGKAGVPMRELGMAPFAFVDIAGEIASAACCEAEEEKAKRAGYSCALEMRMVEEAKMEMCDW